MAAAITGIGGILACSLSSRLPCDTHRGQKRSVLRQGRTACRMSVSSCVHSLAGKVQQNRWVEAQPTSSFPPRPPFATSPFMLRPYLKTFPLPCTMMPTQAIPNPEAHRPARSSQRKPLVAGVIRIHLSEYSTTKTPAPAAPSARSKRFPLSRRYA